MQGYLSFPDTEVFVINFIYPIFENEVILRFLFDLKFGTFWKQTLVKRE